MIKEPVTEPIKWKCAAINPHATACPSSKYERRRIIIQITFANRPAYPKTVVQSQNTSTPSMATSYKSNVANTGSFGVEAKPQRKSCPRAWPGYELLGTKS